MEVSLISRPSFEPCRMNHVGEYLSVYALSLHSDYLCKVTESSFLSWKVSLGLRLCKCLAVLKTKNCEIRKTAQSPCALLTASALRCAQSQFSVDQADERRTCVLLHKLPFLLPFSHDSSFPSDIKLIHLRFHFLSVLPTRTFSTEPLSFMSFFSHISARAFQSEKCSSSHLTFALN